MTERSIPVALKPIARQPIALKPGATIGILGGGQLGRMLSVAASRLGFITKIFEPGANPPAGHVADAVVTAPYEDTKALVAFGCSVDVVTYEFENVPNESLDALQEVVAIHPNRAALGTSQDRLVEKDFLSGLGLAVAPYAAVDDAAGLTAAVEDLGAPAILKSRRLGYDGKGQVRIADSNDIGAAVEALDGVPSVLEGFVDFSAEISVIAARSGDGSIVCFDPGENVHSDGILRTTTVPASVSAETVAAAVKIAQTIAAALNYIGVLGVELFVTPTGLVVNEIAPRVHNSGHWTQDGCIVDQFEQHVRAITGLPLGDGQRHSDIRMENLIGDDMQGLDAVLANPRAAVHLYGKAEVRAGRKMAHVNHLL